MNKSRRARLAAAISDLKKAKSLLDSAKDEIDDIKDDEESARDGLEEHFSETDRYYTMDNNVSEL